MTPKARPEKLELKVIRIGNSRGVRLPKEVLSRYQIREAVVLEVRDDGLLLKGKRDGKLSWEETYRACARERENWKDLEATLADGLDEEVW
jgi:antitoxin MazE